MFVLFELPIREEALSNVAFKNKIAYKINNDRYCNLVFSRVYTN
jgi:hypothetical protein